MKKEDYELVYKNWTSNPKVSRYVEWNVHKSIDDTKAYIENKANRYENDEFYFDWIVVLKEIMEPIGEIEAVKVSEAHDLVEMGDCYGSRFWNKGYATEALKAFMKYMFNEVEAGMIIACHISTNPASGRVMQKAGMKYDATLKKYFVDKNSGKRADKVCYSISREEYFQKSRV
ncbi:MAG: GNAT family N-acetyltransferase [Christensenella sp.]|nr:GNAT family N-acetyltransferase [Christensenella sp.]